jgi:hypothetical protein
LTVSKAAPSRAKSATSRRKTGGERGRVLPRTLKARSRPTDTTLQRHVSFFDDNGDRGVDIDQVQKAKHDGDTGILGKRGRFVARRFGKAFGARSTVDRNGDKALRAARMKSFYDGTLFYGLAKEHAWLRATLPARGCSARCARRLPHSPICWRCGKAYAA